MLKVLVNGPIDSEIKNGIFKISRKNSFVQISQKESSLKFFIEEKKEDEELYVTASMSQNQCALIGSECCNNYDCQKSVDFFYLHFYPRIDFAKCYLYDLKRTIGAGVDVIEHLIDQLINSIRYTKSVLAYYNVIKYEIFLGFITELYDGNGLADKIIFLENQNSNVTNKPIPPFIAKSQQKCRKYDPKKIPILKNFLQGRLNFDGFVYEISCFQSVNKVCNIDFVNGMLK